MILSLERVRSHVYSVIKKDDSIYCSAIIGFVQIKSTEIIKNDSSTCSHDSQYKLPFIANGPNERIKLEI